jgi:hypothetical protein
MSFDNWDNTFPNDEISPNLVALFSTFAKRVACLALSLSSKKLLQQVLLAFKKKQISVDGKTRKIEMHALNTHVVFVVVTLNPNLSFNNLTDRYVHSINTNYLKIGL